MLDRYANQASGLLGLGCHPPGPKLIAMVSHGDEHAELPLLWQLCLSWVKLGYSITVLDGTTAESDANPGLEQSLTNTHWPDDAASGMPSWTVIPSAKGIHNLCASPEAPAGRLQHLRRMVVPEGVLALYCNAEYITSLLGDRNAEPLLAATSTQTSLLTSYMALKRLLISGKLKPTIIHMLNDSNLDPNSSTMPTSSGLVACAKRFLGYECRAQSIQVPHNDSQPSAGIQSLALRLLENSMTLGATDVPSKGITRLTQLRRFDQFAESH
jgi:hypothetical protein